MAYTDQDVTSWAELVNAMEGIAVSGDDAADVEEGAANLSSGAGLYFHVPQEIADLVFSALKTGYGQALQDVRDGKVNDLGPIEQLD